MREVLLDEEDPIWVELRDVHSADVILLLYYHASSFSDFYVSHVGNVIYVDLFGSNLFLFFLFRQVKDCMRR